MLNTIHGHGATVAYGSPKPLIWVRILVPVLIPFMVKCLHKPKSSIVQLFLHLQSCFKAYFAHTFLIMNKFGAFVKDSYVELTEKVSWPKWEQLQQSTMIVLGATLFITAIVALMDFVANGSMKFIYSLFATTS